MALHNLKVVTGLFISVVARCRLRRRPQLRSTLPAVLPRLRMIISVKLWYYMRHTVKEVIRHYDSCVIGESESAARKTPEGASDPYNAVDPQECVNNVFVD